MGRAFTYCRVSTDNQTTTNQVLEISTAGFAIEGQRVIEEVISGATAAKERPPQFSKLNAAGRMTMQVLAAVAEFERDLLIEGTQSGLARAKADGKRLGRPEATKTKALVQEQKAMRFSQSQVAAKLGLGIATVKCHWRV